MPSTAAKAQPLDEARLVLALVQRAEQTEQQGLVVEGPVEVAARQASA